MSATTAQPFHFLDVYFVPVPELGSYFGRMAWQPSEDADWIEGLMQVPMQADGSPDWTTDPDDYPEPNMIQVAYLNRREWNTIIAAHGNPNWTADALHVTVTD